MNRIPSKKVLWAMVATAGVIAALQPLRAATDTWTGTNSGLWSDPSNWAGTGNAPPAATGDAIVFDGTSTNETTTDDYATLTSFTTLSFTAIADPYTLNGTNSLAVTTSVVNNGTNVQTVSLPLTYSTSVTMNGGTGGLNMAGSSFKNTAASGTQLLSLTGTGTISDNITNGGAAGTSITANAANSNWTIVDNPTSTPVTLALGNLTALNGGTLNYGTATSAPTFTITSTSGGDHTIGSTTGTSTFNMVNGNLTLKTRLNSVNGNINISGGNLTVWNQMQLSNGAATNVSVMTITGGLLDVRNSSGSSSTGTIFMASRGNGTFNINGGTVQCGTVDVARGAAAGVATGVLNLNNGTLLASQISTATNAQNAGSTGSTGTLNFNGGTLKARGTQANFITSGGTPAISLTVVVKSGGAIIDSNTFNIGTAKALTHDATLGATADGGLTKLSAGTLTLSGANTYTGVTTVKGGTLALTSATANNNVASSSKLLIGDSLANNTAILDVTGITAAGGFKVASGQTLAGFGSITGDATLDTGSILAPGNSAGTLTETGNATLASGITLNYDLDQPNQVAGTGGNDLYAISGNLTINPNLTLNVTAGANFGPGTYHLITYGGLLTDNSASFTGWTATGIDPSLFSYAFASGQNSVDLVVNTIAAPEPGSLLVLGLGTLALIRRRK